MIVDKQQINLLEKIEQNKIEPYEAYSNNLLTELIFKEKYVRYTLYSNVMTGRYQIKRLHLTNKGRTELGLALENQQQIDDSNLKIILFIGGLCIGVLAGKLLFHI